MTAEERRTDRYMAERAAALAKVHMNTPIGEEVKEPKTRGQMRRVLRT